MLWIINGKRIKNFLFILLAAFFAALILFVQSQDTDVFTPIKESGALSHVETRQKQLALTFDCSQGNQQVKEVLNELKKEHVTATFFFSGTWARQHKDLVRKAAKDRHEIESLGMDSQDLTDMSVQAIRREILMGSEAIFNSDGMHPQMYRPPYGSMNSSSLHTASDLGVQVVLWNVNPHDGSNPGYTVIVRRVLENAGSGDIIRLDASDSALQTYRTLPLIIREMENRGYRFVTLKTLVADARTQQQQIR